MNKYIILLVVLIIAGAGGYFALNTKPPQNTPQDVGYIPSQTPADTVSSPAMQTASDSAKKDQTYSLDEIALHNQATDCWFAVDGEVYDVTKYIDGGKHPGGKALLEGCGKDASKLFNTRPMGSGTPHSDKAKNYLGTFKIGTLN